MTDDIVKFVRRRDYKFVRELGRGGCGKTVLLQDDIIDRYFVCKKYEPSDSGRREELFSGFMNEIRLLHQVLHPNVVRIFNYHVMPEQQLGYIMMEYVEGDSIDRYIERAPNNLLHVFNQTIAAFCHLEECGILHRDLRCENILVSSEGIVKVIDLGFGKRITGVQDFKKSITLNWQFTPPSEFTVGTYDFATEVYFVGKLFEYIVAVHDLADDTVVPVLQRMCADKPSKRFQSFQAVRVAMDQAELLAPEFGKDVIKVYRSFADQLTEYVAELAIDTAFVTDLAAVVPKLEKVYEDSMLEDSISGGRVAWCFLEGGFRCYDAKRIDVDVLKAFLKLLKTGSAETKRIVLGNLLNRLDQLPRYDSKSDDEIPF